MSNENLKQRTKKFALEVIKLVETLPNDRTSHVIGGQLLRAGTSVGANYRAACRAKSAADFISKMGTVEEEADESGYWVELLVDAAKVKSERAAHVLEESGELVAIAVASINTARRNNVPGSTRASANPIPRSPLRVPQSSRTIPHSALRTPH
jgi:four helix bundle protein